MNGVDTRMPAGRNLEAFRRKAGVYRQLAELAEREVGDQRIAAMAREAARAYEEGLYRALAGRARDLAVQHGDHDLARRISLNLPLARDPRQLPGELVNAIEEWKGVSHFRPEPPICD